MLSVLQMLGVYETHRSTYSIGSRLDNSRFFKWALLLMIRYSMAHGLLAIINPFYFTILYDQPRLRSYAISPHHAESIFSDRGPTVAATPELNMISGGAVATRGIAAAATRSCLSVQSVRVTRRQSKPFSLGRLP